MIKGKKKILFYFSFLVVFLYISYYSMLGNDFLEVVFYPSRHHQFQCYRYLVAALGKCVGRRYTFIPNGIMKIIVGYSNYPYVIKNITPDCFNYLKDPYLYKLANPFALPLPLYFFTSKYKLDSYRYPHNIANKVKKNLYDINILFEGMKRIVEQKEEQLRAEIETKEKSEYYKIKLLVDLFQASHVRCCFLPKIVS